MTDYWNFDEYSVGEPWDYNQEFKDLDEQAMRYGPLADRPDASNVPDGRKWLDEYGRISKVSGNSWVLEDVGNSNNRIPNVFADGVNSGDFELPEGAKIDEDGGEVVVKDSNGTIVLRRNETDNSWEIPDDLSVSTLEATDVLTAPKHPTRSDVPDKEGIYRVENVDGEGNFGVIVREL